MAETLTSKTPESVTELRKLFGRRVAALRKEKSLTQEELARQLKKDPVFVAYIEGGQRSPSFVTLHKLAKTLGVHPAELFKF